MDKARSEPLPVEMQLALAHTPAGLRDKLRVAFDLDRRLARIVSATTEPMLGQMRLAWWRETLGQHPTGRPRGDAVLDAIGKEWRSEEGTLVDLVNGWEHMLAETLDRGAADAFANGRAAPFAALAPEKGAEPLTRRAGRRWALADAASRLSESDERILLLDLAREDGRVARLPRGLKGLAMLDALARRSIRRGGAPLMEGRGASLTAARAALIGH